MIGSLPSVCSDEPSISIRENISVDTLMYAILRISLSFCTSNVIMIRFIIQYRKMILLTLNRIAVIQIVTSRISFIIAGLDEINQALFF